MSLDHARTTSGRAATTVGLLAISAVGAVLRCYRLGQNSLWTDEIASLRTASERFWTIPQAALRHNAFEPPLYFWLLHLITGAFGDGEATLRILSAISGALTIPLVWFLVWELSHQRQVATLSALFLALNPLHLWYSQEARPYALLVFFGTAALHALACALHRPSHWLWGAFVVCTSLAMLTHPVGSVLLVVAWVWMLLGANRARVALPLSLSSAASLLLIAPAYVPLARSIASANDTGSPARALTGLELPYTAFTYLGGYSFGPSVREIQNSGWEAAAASHVALLGLAAVILAFWLVLALANRSPLQALLLVLFAIPAVLPLIGSAVTAKAYNTRYTVLGLIGFISSLSVAVVTLRRSVRSAVVAVLCLVFLWADAQWFFASRFRKDDSRAAVAWLHARFPSGAVVAVAPDYATATLAHYAARSGVHLCLVGLAPEGVLPRERTLDALVITRLHHVSQWRELEAEFIQLAGPSLERGTAIGYTLLARGQSQARAASSRACADAHDTIATP